MHIIIYGPEGSGKGTQAKLLGDFLNLPVFTAGDLVREAAIKNKGELGNAARLALTSGKYLSDKDMFELLREKLATKQAKKGFILDGFPRNLDQAKFLLRETQKSEYKIDKLIYLKLSDEEAQKRLLKRKRPLFTGSKLLHDTPERILQRLKTYRQLEEPVLKLFREKKLVLEIEGDNTPEIVFKNILQGLKFPQ
ncbi:nucleoside monophosphate kinase [Candidatus Gottesmanbacteria bacterium]|nr:nucleoside monophosphate kinase [Candidatus Gottesmanbacteria bacterium]MBI5452241.1 nucleoside monophosphate kinase [Candidatus Gottesmanbacteria bacterium]